MEFTQTFPSSGHGLMKPSEQKAEQRSVHDMNRNKSGHTISEFRPLVKQINFIYYIYYNIIYYK